MTPKENPTDTLVFLGMEPNGLNVAWQREDGSRYGQVLTEQAEIDEYLISEGLEPKQFFKRIDK